MILVTGASGGLGRLILDRLTALGADVVGGTREPAALGGSARRIDFDDPASLDFSGVDVLLLISAGYGEDDDVTARHGAAIDAAERAGVGHIVYTSLSGAGDHLTFAMAHRWTERRLRRGRASWTILRNGLYAELLGQITNPHDGVITAPLGEGRLAAVAREDLADVAAHVAAAPAAHASKIYELVGDRALGAAEIAETLSVQYRPATLADSRAMLSALGLAPFQVPMMMSIFSAIAGGFLDGTNSDLAELLGTRPRSALDVIRRAGARA